ncbi:MAG: siderophore-interacting protein [Bdellovibrionota bacterium]
MASLKQTILGWVGDKFLETATVSSVESVSENFRIITLHAAALTKVRWASGGKIQINVGEWNVRTYTPVSIDSETGQLRIVAYLHGKGPGSRWASEIKVGDECQYLGPRESLAPDSKLKPVVVFGDETSLGLAATCRKLGGENSHYHFVFEVTDVEECLKVCRELEIAESSTLVAKVSDGSHLDEVCQHLQNTYDIVSRGQLILTGNLKSIRSVKNNLQARGFSSTRMKTKVYWAEGQTGID